METCYKLFRSDIIKKIPLKEKRFGFEPEVTAKISRVEGDGSYLATYTYNDEGKIIEENYEEGWRTIYVYETGKVTRETYRPDGTYHSSNIYIINEKGLCTAFTETLYGRTYYFEYDANDRKVSGHSISAEGEPFQQYYYFYEGGNLVKDSTVYVSDQTSIVNTYEFFTNIKSTTGNYNIGIFYLGKDNENMTKRINRNFKGVDFDVYDFAIPATDNNGHIMQTSYSINGGGLTTTNYTYY